MKTSETDWKRLQQRLESDKKHTTPSLNRKYGGPENYVFKVEGLKYDDLATATVIAQRLYFRYNMSRPIPITIVANGVEDDNFSAYGYYNSFVPVQNNTMDLFD
jgi:hypothetical protein